jgi:RNA polymerase sigma factor (sigma-70 family)
MRVEDRLEAGFETHRAHLRGVAYRMLGSSAEADDAVQQAWLRASRADRRDVENLAGWLTAITARVCLDMLRARGRRRERPLVEVGDRVGAGPQAGRGPGDEAELAESVGLALLVVLDRLSPVQRVAFVLHDLFAVPFEDIAPVLERSTVATRKLASRARGRVRGATNVATAESADHRALVDAFLAAARGGDLDALLELLAPGVVRRADRFAVPGRAAAELRGARAVAEASRVGARAPGAEVALVDGEPGIVVAPHGRLTAVLRVVIDGGRITEIEIIADPGRLETIPIAVPAAGA